MLGPDAIKFFDKALSVFLPWVPEPDIDSVLWEWYRGLPGTARMYVQESSYYDLLEPVLRAHGELDG